MHKEVLHLHTTLTGCSCTDRSVLGFLPEFVGGVLVGDPTCLVKVNPYRPGERGVWNAVPLWIALLWACTGFRSTNNFIPPSSPRLGGISLLFSLQSRRGDTGNSFLLAFFNVIFLIAVDKPGTVISPDFHSLAPEQLLVVSQEMVVSLSPLET